MSKVFIRLDDIGIYSETLCFFLTIFSKLRIPVHLAIVPSKIKKKDIILVNEITNRYKSNDLFELWIHGFKHENQSNSKKKYEFGDNISKEKQLNYIEKSIKLAKNISKQTNIKLNYVFVPPWDNFNDTTLECLNKKNIKKISLDQKHKVNDFRFLFYKITNFIDKKDDMDCFFIEDISKFIYELKNEKEKLIGVSLHIQNFKSLEDKKKLFKILKIIKNNFDIVKISNLKS